MERLWPSTSVFMISEDSPCSGELAESFISLPSASMSKRTEALVSAMTDTRLSAAANSATSMSTAVAQEAGSSCL